MKNNSYQKLFFMGVLSFISMYILMYAMVNKLENAYPNINQFYMAGIMTMPMMIIELFLMKHMYRNKKLNSFLISMSVAGLVIFFYLEKLEITLIKNEQK